MKNILLFTLLYLFSSERSLAQYDFPDTGYVWRVINFNGFGNPAPKYDLHAEDYVDWKGKTYIRVDVYGDFGFERKNLLIYRYDSGRVYIKQNKFQYPLTDKDTNEFLLYDYNMNVGDSITYQKNNIWEAGICCKKYRHNAVRWWPQGILA